MKILLTAACVMAIAISCNSSTRARFLSTKNLPATVFSINPDKDTVLFSPNGASISIKAGSLRSSVNPVQLELQEAYSSSDIDNSGLDTTSNGQPITSNGIIWFSPADNQSVEIVKPVLVNIPASFISKDMVLYEGEIKNNELVNWKAASSPRQQVTDIGPSLTTIIRLEYGKKLFYSNCASCHSLRSDNFDMRNVMDRMKRVDPEHPKLLYAWTRDPQAVLASGNTYYNQLFEKWNKTPMQGFPELTDRDLSALYNYLDHTKTTAGWQSQSDSKNLFLDSCVKAFETKIKANSNYIDTNHYQISIAAFGWYNIAAPLSNGDELFQKNRR